MVVQVSNSKTVSAYKTRQQKVVQREKQGAHMNNIHIERTVNIFLLLNGNTVLYLKLTQNAFILKQKFTIST